MIEVLQGIYTKLGEDSMFRKWPNWNLKLMRGSQERDLLGYESVKQMTSSR